MFGGFTLDLRRQALLRGDARVHLTSKPLKTLIYLVEQRGQVVSKEALLYTIWKDTAVTDGVLVQAVREIRRVLDDDKDNPTFIQTIPREGYRFVGEVVVGEIGNEPPVASAPRSRSAPRWRFELLVVGIALVFAAVMWRSYSGAREFADPTVPSDDGDGRVVPLTPGAISAVKPVFSPDGGALLYVTDAPEASGVLDLFLMPLKGGHPWRLTQMANAAGDMPVFTHDGKEIVFSRYRNGSGGNRMPDLWKVSSYGGPPVRYIAEASGAGFSPDGAWVAYTRHGPRGRTLMLSSTQRIDPGREISTPGFTPRWSPDGRWLAYTTSYTEGGAGELWIGPTSRLDERRRLTTTPQQMYGLAWSADSRSIVFASKVGSEFHLWRVRLPGGPIDALTSGVGSYVSPTVSADGRLLAFALVRPVRDLVVAHPLDAETVSSLTTNEFHRWPRLSPSGRLIASVVQRSTPGDYLYVTNVETGDTRRVSDVAAEYPSWVDEDRVAYLAPARGGAVDIRQVSLASGENSTVARLGTSASWLAIRPGAPEAAFVRTSGNQRQLVLRDLASGRESILTEAPDVEALRWRSDGKLLAWSGPPLSADARSNGVCVIEPGRSTAPHRIVPDGYGPVWTNDGAVFFVRHLGDRDQAGIWRMDPTTGRELQIRRVARVDYFDVAGDALVFARSTGRSQVLAMPLR